MAKPMDDGFSFSWLNIGLAAIALALLLCYVMQTNMLAAQTWKINKAQDSLASILEERNSLVAQQSELDDRQVLQDLAVKEGFEPAGAVVYLVQDTAVASVR